MNIKDLKEAGFSNAEIDLFKGDLKLILEWLGNENFFVFSLNYNQDELYVEYQELEDNDYLLEKEDREDIETSYLVPASALEGLLATIYFYSYFPGSFRYSNEKCEETTDTGEMTEDTEVNCNDDSLDLIFNNIELIGASYQNTKEIYYFDKLG